MADRIFIGVAWPYANYVLHLGHQVLEVAADAFARYHRLQGNRVLMVSGSDCHGTPITVAAEAAGKEPAQVAQQYHALTQEHFKQLGYSYDLFTHTMTDNHTQTTQEIFTTLLENGFIYRDSMAMLHCTPCNRYLPDRYVLGGCPHCEYDDARGDQCDECGKQLNPTDLKSPRCSVCSETPTEQTTEHFFLDLKKLAPKITEWFETHHKHMRPNVVRFTTNLLETIRERAITRDIQWGVPIPLDGFDDKRIYVWFDAVIGYLSASRQWAAEMGDPEAWKPWWTDPACKQYYFLGKDNIPFHTIIWPGMLLGCGDYTLPYDVPANEYLTMEGKQFSKSRGVVIKIDDFLSKYQPDALRFYITINGPETSDASFTWTSFQQRVNDELVGKWGNLAHRALHFAYNKLDGVVPNAPSAIDAEGSPLLASVDAAFVEVGDLIAHCRFKAALTRAMETVSEGNVYFDKQAPWKQIKENRAACEQTLSVCLQAINGLKTLLAPFCPFASERLHQTLGFDGDLFAQKGWQRGELPAGQSLREPKPLFAKIDDAQIQAELESVENDGP